ncbi:MerR family transcriptional regulator [Metasolibacillus sp.]|uniref:MerR family transcriptional regulator n=1 Tax=Metasolibacillus sp. TaxID=2703680 RepID=UPI002600FFFA|nr:MerR family transcriptional regulator [Metasolibacillus sp.]MCT6925259.1 MerR family transcriptional regulator [Metasolibacillus sp.]MCT6941511.1 MerR family transcriptional regulator [Metasolibacillus sp.]
MLKIGELAEMTGITKRTIDYYTNLGLLKAKRSSSNYRYYNQEAIEQLHFIERKKKEGLSLEQIKHLIEPKMEEIDIQDIRVQMQQLEKEVALLVTKLSKEDQLAKQNIVTKMKQDSNTLIRSLLLLIT